MLKQHFPDFSPLCDLEPAHLIYVIDPPEGKRRDADDGFSISKKLINDQICWVLKIYIANPYVQSGLTLKTFLKALKNVRSRYTKMPFSMADLEDCSFWSDGLEKDAVMYEIIFTENFEFLSFSVKECKAYATKQTTFSYEEADSCISSKSNDQLVLASEFVAGYLSMSPCFSTAKIQEETVSCKIVEVFMILANVYATDFLSKQKHIYPIYRRYEKREMGSNTSSVCKTKSEFVENTNMAYYSLASGPHKGLSLEKYGTFTSPIRRFSDLLQLLILLCYLRGVHFPFSLSALRGMVRSINSTNDYYAYQDYKISLARQRRRIEKVKAKEEVLVSDTAGIKNDAKKSQPTVLELLVKMMEHEELKLVKPLRLLEFLVANINNEEIINTYYEFFCKRGDYFIRVLGLIREKAGSIKFCRTGKRDSDLMKIYFEFSLYGIHHKTQRMFHYFPKNEAMAAAIINLISLVYNGRNVIRLINKPFPYIVVSGRILTGSVVKHTAKYADQIRKLLKTPESSLKIEVLRMDSKNIDLICKTKDSIRPINKLPPFKINIGQMLRKPNPSIPRWYISEIYRLADILSYLIKVKVVEKEFPSVDLFLEKRISRDPKEESDVFKIILVTSAKGDNYKHAIENAAKKMYEVLKLKSGATLTLPFHYPFRR